MIALIPARMGSKRLPFKNVRLLDGLPLACWTVRAAFESKVFDKVYLSTESQDVAQTVLSYTPGVEVIMRPDHMAQDNSIDLQWVRHALETIRYREDAVPPEFSILRPTSPFRDGVTIQGAAVMWREHRHHADSLRAIRPATEHPFKQWWKEGKWITPLHKDTPPYGTEYRWSHPTQEFRTTYIQTAGLEIAWSAMPLEHGTISGIRILGYELEGAPALDINTEDDWRAAEAYLQNV